jgi:hypothetical protein
MSKVCKPSFSDRALGSDIRAGRNLTTTMQSVLGSGVFNTNGDLWRFHRNMSRPFFTRDRLKGMVPVFVRHADKALDKLDAHLALARSLSVDEKSKGSTASIDVQDLASRFTLDAATDFLFGGCVNSLDEQLVSQTDGPSPSTVQDSTENRRRSSSQSILPLNNSDPLETPSVNTTTPTSNFRSAFDSALQTLASRLRSGSLWPLMEITKDSTAKEVTIIRTFVRGIVARALAKRDRRERKVYGPGEGMRSPYAANLDEKGRLSETEEDDADNGTETLLDHLLKVSDGEYPLDNGISLLII